MYAFLIAIFVLVSILLMFVILIQSSRGGGLAGTFGGGGDTFSTVFGGKGSAPFLTKATAVLAGLFLVIALLLGMITRGSVSKGSLVEQEREKRMSSPARTLPQVAEPTAPQPEQVPQK